MKRLWILEVRLDTMTHKRETLTDDLGSHLLRLLRREGGRETARDNVDKDLT